MSNNNCLRRTSAAIVNGFETFFFWYGYLVATHKWHFLLGTFCFTALCCLGFLNFRAVQNPYELWIPRGSDSVENNLWLEENYPIDTRFNNFLITKEHGDILTPEVLREMLDIYKEVRDIELTDGSHFEDLCKKVPVPDLAPDRASELFSHWNPFEPIEHAERRSNCSDIHSPEYDPSVCMEPETYCRLVNETFSEICYERSILELWGYDEAVYERLTRKDILDKVNQPNLTREVAAFVVYKTPFALDRYLNATREEHTGRIIGGVATSMTWMGQVDDQALEDGVTGAGLPVDKNSLEFESRLYDVLSERQVQCTQHDFTCYINLARAYDDLAVDAIVNDALFLPLGFGIVFIYIMVVLGNYHWVETRAMLALSGLAAIALTVIVCIGLCSALGLLFSPMHNSIPFILLGIGIDDMFVIIQCYDNLKRDELRWGDHAYNIALALSNAGSAITVTSLTDFIVFIIGASSRLPALSSYCVYCAVGIVTVFVFQASFFIACLAFDLERVEQGRNGCLLCYEHKDYVYEYKDKKSNGQKLFGFIGHWIMKIPVKIFLILVTLTFLGVAIWGITGLEVYFESRWFLPEDSYMRLWIEADEDFFPSQGESGIIYMTDLDYPQELSNIESLVSDLTAAEESIKTVNSWYPSFKEYLNYHIGLSDDGQGVPEEILPFDDFSMYTSQYLYSPLGSLWQSSFYPDDDQKVCGSPISKLALTSFYYTHQRFFTTEDHLDGMNEVKEIIAKQNFSANVFAVAPAYANWEIDEVIKSELYRNLGVSLCCIFVTTLILLANFRASVLVMVCVCMVLTNVLGFMYFWGLTIDVVSSINVIISVGLCVDYSAHIGHTFLGVKGSKRERAIQTMYDIGPAVLNGGFSTFIAIVILSSSDSHVFKTFFKVFFLVVVFGLFHGLIFLPILLSLLGPASYDFKEARQDHEATEYIIDKYDAEDKRKDKGIAAQENRRLLLVGGALDDNNEEIYGAFVNMSGGVGVAKVGVITAASSDPQDSADWYTQAFLDYGAAETYWIPVNENDLSPALNQSVADRVNEMTGVFFGGGDQLRVINSLYAFDSNDNRVETPVMTALRERYESGDAAMGGTSAGAACMSGGVMIEGGYSYEALRYGAYTDTPHSDYLLYVADGGLGFAEGVVVDTHFSQRGREGRLMRLLADTKDTSPIGTPFGIGVDENTALAVTKDLTAGTMTGEVLGENGVYFVDVQSAVIGEENHNFAMSDVYTHFLLRGDLISLDTWTVVSHADYKEDLTGNEFYVLGETSDKIFNGNRDGINVYPELTRVATSIFDSQAQSTTGTTEELHPMFTLTFTKEAGLSVGYGGYDPYTILDEFDISYEELRVDIAVL